MGLPRGMACLFWALAMAASVGPATAATTLEYEVKAAFLLNFTKFIEWPANAFADAGAPFTICILGRDPFGQALEDVVAGETVDGRRLAVRRIDSPPPTQSCQIVFQADNGKKLDPSPAGTRPGVLTVGDGETYIREGGIIAFVIDKHRVRFDVNQTAAEHAQLKLSSKLLNVARSVTK